MHWARYACTLCNALERMHIKTNWGQILLLFGEHHLLLSTLSSEDGTDLVTLCELAPALWISLFEQHLIVCDGENLQITDHILN